MGGPRFQKALLREIHAADLGGQGRKGKARGKIKGHGVSGGGGDGDWGKREWGGGCGGWLNIFSSASKPGSKGKRLSGWKGKKGGQGSIDKASSMAWGYKKVKQGQDLPKGMFEMNGKGGGGWIK